MSDITSINHTAMAVHDIDEAERFYMDVLGAIPHDRVCYDLEEVKIGWAVFKSYEVGDYLLALTTARSPMTMPADGQMRGAHGFRHGFQVARARFDAAIKELSARGIPFQGPIEQPAGGPFGQSIYFHDPSGNFLELVWRRDEAAMPLRRSYVSAE